MMKVIQYSYVLLAATISSPVVEGFMTSQSTRISLLKKQSQRALALSSCGHHHDVPSFQEPAISAPSKRSSAQATLASLALISAVSFAPLSAQAYSDYASDTVQSAIQSLTEAAGDKDKTFQAYENLAEIIAEGKGIGGAVNYKGVTLERGYIADEDTSIYNPGLTLLTEGEKEQLVNAVINARKVGLEKNQWSDNNQLAYDELKTKLDPLHMTELRGYLKFVPALAGVLYLAVLAVQQAARDLFPTAYIGAALAIFAPIVLLVVFGS